MNIQLRCPRCNEIVDAEAEAISPDYARLTIECRKCQARDKLESLTHAKAATHKAKR